MLTGGLNISAGTKGFLEKRGKLEEHTGLFLNKWFLKVAVWNEAAITSRGEALADMAVKIWPALPEPVVQNEEGTSP